MEDNGGGVVENKAASYTYWVRGATQDAAPLPVPRKLSAEDLSKQPQPATLGSVWNQWLDMVLQSIFLGIIFSRLEPGRKKTSIHGQAIEIKELLKSVDSLEFSSCKAHIDEVSKCSGDAFLVTVRNKKRVGYTYELSLKFKGEYLIGKENKMIKGHLDIPEFSFGELDDLQIEVRLSEEKDLASEDKMQICKDLKSFLSPIREKLLEFEKDLKDR